MLSIHNLKVRFILTWVLFASCLLVSVSAQAFTVTVNTSLVSPQPLGTTITLSAQLAGQHGVDMEYQFSVIDVTTGKWRILSDFNPSPDFHWTSIQEGFYALIGVAHDRSSNESQVGFLSYLLTSRVSNGLPVVNPTKNSLVGLFSAPPCNTGLVRVRYTNLLGDPWQVTPWRVCLPGRGVNEYVAGLLPSAIYVMQTMRLVDGEVEYGPLIWFQSGVLPAPFELAVIADLPDPTTSLLDDILISSYLIVGGTTNYFMATDLLGRAVWYFDEVFARRYSGTPGSGRNHAAIDAPGRYPGLFAQRDRSGR